MSSDPESSDYTPLYGEDKQCGSHTLDYSRKLRLSLIVVVCVAVASVMGLVAPVALMRNSSNGAINFVQKTDLEILHDFQGNTREYKVFPGGHLSATLRHVESGSESTQFMLDHRLEYIVYGEIHVTDGTG
eukprot:gnl/MRDRNA2_/MRDRNA2_256842_c0_seq1.p1 gnl/MRDRNA2_/MRDRNA2_256842_c0~~gnl/MRDRNA2_/MRDRNA2_256842_c0_seq1.p1  ORF type:complete len:131 (-),score=10.02 gnl/MRDRNA2_/MRDRNA2_256842_c0_seq1:121-513(-)